jgi:hypothetical protein
MQSWVNWIKRHVGPVAFMASAIVFAGLELGSMHSSMTPARVPVVTALVPAGARITPHDIRWVKETAVRAVEADTLNGYARTTLFPGEILSPPDVSRWSQRVALVAVAPTNPADVAVLPSSSYVDVVIFAKQQIAWQSGPVLIIGRQSAMEASIAVAMPFRQAMQFEEMKNRGTVAVIGMSS